MTMTLGRSSTGKRSARDERATPATARELAGNVRQPDFVPHGVEEAWGFRRRSPSSRFALTWIW